MNHQQTVNEIERVFHALHVLLQKGQFTERDVEFMEAFLEKSLENTRELKERIEDGTKSNSGD